MNEPNDAPTGTRREVDACIAFCDEQIVLQQAKLRDAAQSITVYATEHASGAVLGPDRDEMAHRGAMANWFWRTKRCLMLVSGGPSDA